MKLYSRPASPYAARVRGSIHAKGLNVELVDPPLDWKTSESFLAINPLGRIPVLVLDDGTLLPESGVIVEYLEDAFPEPSLRPRSPEGRAQVRLITQVAENYVTPAMMPLFALYSAKEKDQAAIEAQIARFDDALGKLDAMLSPKQYAHGGQLSTADLWLGPLRFTFDGLMNFSGRKDLLDRHARFAGYIDVVQADPVMSKLWEEMTIGLRQFMARRAAGQA